MPRFPALALFATAMLPACSPADQPVEPGRSEVLFLDDDLMQVTLDAPGEADPLELRELTDCAAATALLEREADFARHVRTNITEEAGISRADAVYTVSSERPAGDFVIVAVDRAANCRPSETTGV